ncbi:MAG: ribonuclease HII [bacterium]|nr:ribonuclease HII [bacterium]
MRYLIGIDEAGRGPLAGPVAVGAVMVPHDFDWKILKGVRDSKQLTPFAREEWYRKLRAMRQAGMLDFSVSFSAAGTIDRRGIVFAIHSALTRCLIKLDATPEQCEIRLDGSLRAPEIFTVQKTIIRGDESEPVISLASIAAKVTRDRLMQRLAEKYPAYDFRAHKGYGTPRHQKMIHKHGLCPLHRTSFCSDFVSGSIK